MSWAAGGKEIKTEEVVFEKNWMAPAIEIIKVLILDDCLKKSKDIIVSNLEDLQI